MAQPKGTSRINLDIEQRLWNKLDMVANKPGVKRKIVEAALEELLKDIPEPPVDYKAKNKRGPYNMPLKSMREVL